MNWSILFLKKNIYDGTCRHMSNGTIALCLVSASSRPTLTYEPQTNIGHEHVFLLTSSFAKYTTNPH